MTGAAATGDTGRLEVSCPSSRSSVPRMRHEAVAFALQHGMHDAVPIGLAVTEAVANAVVHAYRDASSGVIELVLVDEAAHIRVVVRDFGSGMAPRVDSPGLGLGLALIGALAEDIQIERLGTSGTSVTMAFAKQPGLRRVR